MCTQSHLVPGMALSVLVGCSLINKFEDLDRSPTGSEGGAAGSSDAEAATGGTGSGLGGGTGEAGSSGVRYGGTQSSEGKTPGAGSACAPGYDECGSGCVVLGTNANNCGECGNVCPVGMHCVAGTCECPAGRADCSEVCVDTRHDPDNCGDCGVYCQLGEACVAGSCECQGGLTRCGTVCVDLSSHGADCGTCGNACAAGQVCSLGECSESCAPAEAACGSSCANLDKSEEHCGACDAECLVGQSCIEGQCTCAEGRRECDGVCVDVSEDSNNCGQCNLACTGGRSCVGGACVCPNGQSYCDEQCVDVSGDVFNCGQCGVECRSGQSCVNGDCVGGAGGAGTGGEGSGGAGTGGVEASTGGVEGETGGVEASTGGVEASTGGVEGETGGVGGAGTGGQEACLGDSPTRIGVDARSAEGVTLQLCPGVYTTSPVGADEAGADAWLGWSPYSGNSGCSGDTECDCTNGWGYNYLIDVAGDRLRGIRSPVTNGRYCPTAQLAFEQLARVATFTLTEEADVTFRVTDTQTTGNRGGMTFELTREPWVPLSLEGLVAYWPFDTDTLDASGNGFDLEEGLVTYREYGRLGESIVLDGTVDSNARGARVGGACAEPLGLDELPVTVAAWVRPFAGATVGQAVFESQDVAIRHAGVSVLLLPVDETTMQVSAHFGDGTLSSVSGRATVRTDGGVASVLDWHHVGVVFRGLNDIEIYMDGVRVPANDMEGAALVLAEGDPPACPAVGYRSNVGTERYYSGELDEVYVFSRALSTTEILVLARL